MYCLTNGSNVSKAAFERVSRGVDRNDEAVEEDASGISPVVRFGVFRRFSLAPLSKI